MKSFISNIVSKYHNYMLRRRHGIDREQLMGCNVMFSRYMLPKLQFMRMNLHVLTRVPVRLNELGEQVGTMELAEWGGVLDEIIFALQYDCNGGVDIGYIPSHGEQQYITNYMNNVRSDQERYKRGCRLLGLYYGDLWG